MVALIEESGVLDITINAGTTWNKPFAIEVDSSPKNLTGHIIRAAIRKRFNGLLVASLTVANGKVVETDLTNGLFTLLIPAAETATYNNNKATDDFVWDLEIEAPDTTVQRYFDGSVTIRPEVTT